MHLEQPNFFSSACLDRRSEAREDPDWLAAALADPETRYVLTVGTRQLVFTGAAPRIAFADGDNPAVRNAAAQQFVLLGWFGSQRCVMVDLTTSAPEPPAQAGFEELRTVAADLDAGEAALLAYARALTVWRSRQRHCGVCGAATIAGQAGHSLRCSDPACAALYFPRLDPAIIVLVTDGERALLGRQSAWTPGRYSTLAGFVEPGESLEDAVRREVMEETGVRVTAARYHSSQPWPFPASLMVGFYADAHPDPIRLGDELEDARWLTREDLRAGRVQPPIGYSISWRLIDGWLNASAEATARGSR